MSNQKNWLSVNGGEIIVNNFSFCHIFSKSSACCEASESICTNGKGLENELQCTCVHYNIMSHIFLNNYFFSVTFIFLYQSFKYGKENLKTFMIDIPNYLNLNPFIHLFSKMTLKNNLSSKHFNSSVRWQYEA